jgi:hypothetical protein
MGNTILLLFDTPRQWSYKFGLNPEKKALRYKVWACPIPAVENEGKNGIRESRKSSIAP